MKVTINDLVNVLKASSIADILLHKVNPDKYCGIVTARLFDHLDACDTDLENDRYELSILLGDDAKDSYTRIKKYVTTIDDNLFHVYVDPAYSYPSVIFKNVAEDWCVLNEETEEWYTIRKKRKFSA